MLDVINECIARQTAEEYNWVFCTSPAQIKYGTTRFRINGDILEITIDNRVRRRRLRTTVTRDTTLSSKYYTAILAECNSYNECLRFLVDKYGKDKYHNNSNVQIFYDIYFHNNKTKEQIKERYDNFNDAKEKFHAFIQKYKGISYDLYLYEACKPLREISECLYLIDIRRF